MQPTPPTSISASALTTGISYQVRLAVNEADVRAAQHLRFEVFNLELHEGLDTAYLNERDEDSFDEHCAHLLVEHHETGQVVGTYRLQTGRLAALHGGYYSEQEFDFAPYEPLRGEIMELGRACIHNEHRSLAVLNLLWRGIALYAMQREARWLIGCSSLTSQDAGEGLAAYESLLPHLAPPELRTVPHPAFTLPPDTVPRSRVSVPRLLRAYLSMGAKICGPPAIDRDFKTIDFLTLIDLQAMPATARQHFFSA